MAKILIAEDDRTMRGLLSTLLELEGDQPVVVTQSTDILPTAEEIMPDLILLDVHLAGADTFPALQELRNTPRLSEIPVIMISGMGLREKCLRLGATTFILKPFRPQELLQRIRELVE
ncbi:MAG TPA: response regulator [Thermoflexia bacterium]|nr:response regulator [Thermoflexia bacterium]